MHNTIYIGGLDKVELLIKLYNAAELSSKKTVCFNEYLQEAAAGSCNNLSLKK